jgi:hypothetical protein
MVLRAANNPNPVCDEVWGVFRSNDSFPEDDSGKLFELGQCFRICFRSGNDFEQPHVARRIEEVRSKPAAAEIGTSIYCESGNGKTGRIRRY